MLFICFSYVIYHENGKQRGWQPPAPHCCEQLVMGWKWETGMVKMEGTTTKKKRSHNDKKNVTGRHPTLITRGKDINNNGDQGTKTNLTRRTTSTRWQQDGDRDGQPQPHDQHSSGSAQWGGQQPWDKNQRCRWWIQCCMTRNAKGGPRDVVNISWAVGKFISCSFHFIGTNKVFRY